MEALTEQGVVLVASVLRALRYRIQDSSCSKIAEDVAETGPLRQEIVGVMNAETRRRAAGDNDNACCSLQSGYMVLNLRIER